MVNERRDMQTKLTLLCKLTFGVEIDLVVGDGVGFGVGKRVGLRVG